LGPGPLEAGALGGEGVEDRGSGTVVAVAGEPVGPQGVDKDDHKIGRPLGGGVDRNLAKVGGGGGGPPSQEEGKKDSSRQEA